MGRVCKCFGCGEVKDDCSQVDISNISKYNIKYYCQNCIFELFECEIQD